MDKEFIPYILALKLKALGFNEECFNMYFKTSKNLSKLDGKIHKNSYCTGVAAPLWQQAFDWFRKKHNLSGEPKSHQFYFSYYIIFDTLGENTCKAFKHQFKSYDEARKECLEKLIEIVEVLNIIN